MTSANRMCSYLFSLSLSLSAAELHHDDRGAGPVHQRAGWYGHPARGEDRREGPERQHASLPAAALLRSSQRGNGAAQNTVAAFFWVCDFQMNCFLVTWIRLLNPTDSCSASEPSDASSKWSNCSQTVKLRDKLRDNLRIHFPSETHPASPAQIHKIIGVFFFCGCSLISR